MPWLSAAAAVAAAAAAATQFADTAPHYRMLVQAGCHQDLNQASYIGN